MDSSLVHDLASEGERRRLVTPLLLRRARAVTEVPIRHQPKGVPGGHTFLTLLGIAMDYYLLTAKRPFLVSGLVGALGLGVGALVLLFSAVLPAGAALLGLVLAVGGLVIALVSVAGEYAQRSYQLQQGIPFYQLREGAGSDEPPYERPRTTH
jgi:undecaprenyl-phosphate 4-deoxy-4-formamido-L-arabinose transferase